MKKLFMFDTETTGFMKDDKIIQIAIVLGSYDEKTGEFYEERVVNQYINADKPSHPSAQACHLIEKSTIAKFGYMEDYLPEIMSHLQKADYVICHNTSFDMKMLNQEIGENERYLRISNDKKRICTKNDIGDICGLKNKSGKPKRPKLAELYDFLFDDTFEDAHDALVDTRALQKCFFELLKRGVLKLD